MSFICPVCRYKQPFNGKNILSHLRTHLKQHEMVDCPFKDCQYRTNVYSSFNAHKSRNHPHCDVSDFKHEMFLTEIDREQMQVESDDGGPSQNSPELALRAECHHPESRDDTGELQAQLRNNLASLFLKMQCFACITDGYTGNS